MLIFYGFLDEVTIYYSRKGRHEVASDVEEAAQESSLYLGVMIRNCR